MLVAAVLTAFTAGPALGRTTVAPQRSTMSSLVAAGGGPEDFKTTTLVGSLAGTDSNAELAALTRAFGAPAVKGFIVIFDFVIADALRLFGENRAAPPASPDLDPGDGRPCPLRSTVPASIPRRAPSTSKRCSTGWFPRRCGFGS